jgi:hypothetical protein
MRVGHPAPARVRLSAGRAIDLALSGKRRLFLVEGMKMSDEWVSHGLSGRVENIVRFLPGGSYYNVENTRTGEWREVWVGEDQDIGDAIAEGQWADDYDDDSDSESPESEE